MLRAKVNWRYSLPRRHARGCVDDKLKARLALIDDLVRSLSSTDRRVARDFMKHKNVDSRRMNLHQRIALALRKEPWLVPVFAERLRSKLALERSAAGCRDNEREWYIILTLWSPLQVVRLLEDSSERADRLRQNFPFVSLLSDLGLK